jgi:crossover junction endodeoxyribonuclease RuvC
MFVLGIDPGLTRCGFGAVRARPGRQGECVELGVLRTEPDWELPDRLASMHEQLDGLMTRLRPDAVVVERVFFQVNARTAMSVAQASGLALALAAARGCEVVQYTANEVKLSVTGDGAADKRAVQVMVQRMLGLDSPPKPADAADALALALCHLAVAPHHRGTPSLRARNQSVGGSSAPARPLRIATQMGGIALAVPRPRPTGEAGSARRSSVRTTSVRLDPTRPAGPSGEVGS